MEATGIMFMVISIQELSTRHGRGATLDDTTEETGRSAEALLGTCEKSGNLHNEQETGSDAIDRRR